MKKIFLLLVCILAILLSGCKKEDYTFDIKGYCIENNYNLLWLDKTEAKTRTDLSVSYIALVENNEGDLMLFLLDENYSIVSLMCI